jgi:hypothetical protein
VDEFMGGKTGLGNPAIDGFFIDDFWCSDLLIKENGWRGGCSDPRQGPTEIVNTSQVWFARPFLLLLADCDQSPCLTHGCACD